MYYEREVIGNMKAFFIVLLSVIESFPCIAQINFWTGSKGPYEANVQTIAINSKGSIFVEVDHEGLYRSTNNGENWKKVYTGRSVNHTDNNVASFIITKKDDIFAIDNGEIYQSINDGEDWKKVFTSQRRFSQSNEGLFINKSDDIFAIIRGWMYRSTDRGNSWDEIMNGILSPSVESIRIGGDSQEIIICSSFPHQGDTLSGICYSLDNGNHWSPVGRFGDTLVTSPLISKKGSLFGRSYYGIARTTDWGATWSIVSHYSSFFLLSNGDLITCVNHPPTSFRSTDDGDTWLPLSFPYETPVHQVFDAGRIIYVQGDSCVVSVDSGLSWRKASPPSLQKYSHGFAVSPAGDIFAATESGVCRSADSAKTWKSINVGINNFDIRKTEALRNGNIIAIAYSNADLDWGLFQSTDDGESWSRVMSGKQPNGFRDFAVNPKGDVYALNQTELWKLNNNDSNWICINNNGFWNLTHLVVDKKEHFFIKVTGTQRDPETLQSNDEGKTWEGTEFPDYTGFVQNSHNVFFIWTPLEIQRSTDEGIHWNKIFEKKNRDGSKRWVRIIGIDAHNNTYAVSGFKNSPCIVYKSVDNGNHWQQIGKALPNIVRVSALCSDKRGNVYVGTSSGVFRMNRKNGKWDEINSGLDCTDISTLTETMHGYLLAGTSAGGFFRSAQPVGR